MIVISQDFETRSKDDPKVVGLANYAKGCLPLMLAYGTLESQSQWNLDVHAHARDPAIRPSCPDDLRALIEDPDVIFAAHNAAFEIYVWNEVCVKQWGWPEIPIERWRCTAAQGCAANQPRALGNLTKRLSLDEDARKDARGKFLIKALSTPTKAEQTYLKPRKGKDGKSVKEPAGFTKAGKPKFRVVKDVNKLSVQYIQEQGTPVFPMTNDKGKTYDYFFNNDPELMKEYRAYNVQDIVAEATAATKLPPLPEEDHELWVLDRKINMRGIPIDSELCRGAMEVYQEEVNAAHARMAEVTKTEEEPDGIVTKCTQHKRIVDWLNERLDWNIMHPSDKGGGSLAQPIIPDFLATYNDRPHAWGELPWKIEDEEVPHVMPQVLEVLFLRDFAGGTAVAKYKAGVNFVSDDGRVREQLLVFGAATGRWTGKGLQPHNMKRIKCLLESYVNALKSGSRDLVELVGEAAALEVDKKGKPQPAKSVFDILEGCIRGIIKAPKGRKLVVSDFAGIESRVLNWLVGNEYKLDLFRRNEDTYIHAACDIWKVAFDDITEWSDEEQKRIIQEVHALKRQAGKACELGLGYGMGWATWLKGAIKQGMEFTDEEAKAIVYAWRDASPQIPEFWQDIENAARRVIQREQLRQRTKRNPPPRLVEEVCGLKVGWHPRGYLCIRLPSGRMLYYYKPTIMKDRAPDAMNDFRQIFYYDGGKSGSNYNHGRINTYGGKLCENIIQAIARDLLVYSMQIVDRAGLDIIFHVHDEVVVETDLDDDEAFGIVHEAMETLPPWAAGLPLKAESYQAERYTK